ncbi:MAG: hypothetical protein LBD53_01095 [Tannerella sp.]|jgi:hypothetical protein|nr:hypothetical protein [Tannerella sp.]
MKKIDKTEEQTIESVRETLRNLFPDFPKWEKQFAPRPLPVIQVEGKYAVLRPITAKEVSQFSMSVAAGNGLDDACRYLMEELWLGGDNELRDDEEYFIAAMLQVQRIMEVKKSFFWQV